MSRPAGAGRHASRTFVEIAAQVGVSKSTAHRDYRSALLKLQLDLELVPRQELKYAAAKRLAMV